MNSSFIPLESGYSLEDFNTTMSDSLSVIESAATVSKTDSALSKFPSGLRPVGSYYTQYPAVIARDFDTSFPVEERPDYLFGGHWEIVCPDWSFSTADPYLASGMSRSQFWSKSGMSSDPAGSSLQSIVDYQHDFAKDASGRDSYSVSEKENNFTSMSVPDSIQKGDLLTAIFSEKAFIDGESLVTLLQNIIKYNKQFASSLALLFYALDDLGMVASYRYTHIVQKVQDTDDGSDVNYWLSSNDYDSKVGTYSAFMGAIAVEIGVIATAFTTFTSSCAAMVYIIPAAPSPIPAPLQVSLPIPSAVYTIALATYAGFVTALGVAFTAYQVALEVSRVAYEVMLAVPFIPIFADKDKAESIVGTGKKNDPYAFSTALTHFGPNSLGFIPPVFALREVNLLQALFRPTSIDLSAIGVPQAAEVALNLTLAGVYGLYADKIRFGHVYNGKQTRIFAFLLLSIIHLYIKLDELIYTIVAMVAAGDYSVAFDLATNVLVGLLSSTIPSWLANILAALLPSLGSFLDDFRDMFNDFVSSLIGSDQSSLFSKIYFKTLGINVSTAQTVGRDFCDDTLPMVVWKKLSE